MGTRSGRRRAVASGGDGRSAAPPVPPRRAPRLSVSVGRAAVHPLSLSPCARVPPSIHCWRGAVRPLDGQTTWPAKEECRDGRGGDRTGMGPRPPPLPPVPTGSYTYIDPRGAASAYTLDDRACQVADGKHPLGWWGRGGAAGTPCPSRGARSPRRGTRPVGTTRTAGGGWPPVQTRSGGVVGECAWVGGGGGGGDLAACAAAWRTTPPRAGVPSGHTSH